MAFKVLKTDGNILKTYGRHFRLRVARLESDRNVDRFCFQFNEL